MARGEAANHRPPSHGGEPDRRDRLIVLLLTALALAARLPRLGGDLWIDEIATVENFVRIPFSAIVTTYLSANQHVLYSVLAHASIAAFGETSWALRLPALLFGVASVPALYFLARAIGPRREAIAASILLAVSYHHAYFSQSARGYTGYLFFSILSTAYLVRALAPGTTRDWAGFAAASVGNLYMHLNGAFLLAGQVAGAVVFHVARESRRAGRAEGARLARRLAVALGAIAVVAGALYAPIVASMFEFFTTADRNVGWTPSFELVRVILRDAAPGRLALAALALAIPVGVAGLASVARTAPLIPVVMFLPILLGLSAVITMGVGTYPRFFIGLLPFGILVAVRGLAVVAEAGARAVASAPGRRERIARRAFVGLLACAALGAASGLPRLYALPKQDYTGALAFVRAERASGDLVAAAFTATTGACYYDPAILRARGPADLEEILSRGAPVWLVGTFLADLRVREPALAALIDARFGEARRFPGLVGDGAVVVWRSREPSAP